MKLRKVLATVLALSLLASGCTATAESDEEEVVISTPVETRILAKGNIKTELVYAGQLTPRETISVVPKMQGKVKEVFFEIGDRVEKDDVLFTLDEKDVENQIKALSAQLSQANQGVASAQNSLNSATGGQYESQVLQQDASIDGSKAQLDNAEISVESAKVGLENAKISLDSITITYNNTKMLYESGTVSKADFDKVQTGYDQAVLGMEQSQNALAQAELGLAQARNSLQTAESGKGLVTGSIIEDTKRTASIGVATAQSGANVIRVQLDIARETLNDTSVKAPISGTVSMKNVKATEFATAAAPSFVIIDSEKLNVDAKVSELIINKISVGDEVDLYIRSLQDEPFKAKIKTISPSVDQTGTYPVKLELDNINSMIKPGMFSEVRFVNEHAENVIVIPVQAVINTKDADYVFLNDNGVAKKTVIKIGINNGKDVEVTEGLNENDNIIVVGQSYLSEGTLVNVVTRDVKGE